MSIPCDPNLGDEKRAAATRRADVSGTAQWAVLDRALEVGHEIGRWRLDEIVSAYVRTSAKTLLTKRAKANDGGKVTRVSSPASGCN